MKCAATVTGVTVYDDFAQSPDRDRNHDRRPAQAKQKGARILACWSRVPTP